MLLNENQNNASHNQVVPGSSPGGTTSKIKALQSFNSLKPFYLQTICKQHKI